MRKIILLLLLMSSNVFADSLQLTCCSSHYNDRDYNETNPGLVYSHDYGIDKFVNVGVYKNSESNTTVLIGAGKRWEWSKDFDFSVSAGMMTGYQRSVIVPYILPAVTYKDFVTVMGLPVDGGAIAVTFTIASWGKK